jgi:hypothetical protein
MDVSKELPIADEASTCLELFTVICRTLDSADPPTDIEKPRLSVTGERLTDELSRFNVWIGNIGAMKRGKSSLDHRLAHADVRVEVVRLLKQLRSSLSDCGCQYQVRAVHLLIWLYFHSMGDRLRGAKARYMVPQR